MKPSPNNVTAMGNAGAPVSQVKVRSGLLSLLKLLEIRGLLGTEGAGGPAGLKVQKYVYFARFFDYDLGYKYNLYIHGPYSRELAEDYCAIDHDDLKRARPANIRDEERYISLLSGRDDTWLEIASTVMMIAERYPGISEDELADLTLYAKPWAEEEYVRGAVGELRRHALLPYYGRPAERFLDRYKAHAHIPAWRRRRSASS
ncbi:MAG: hypothetical protein ACP5QE_06960 [Conexivisphaera sp.]